MSQIINSSLSLTFRTALGDAVPALGILTLVDGSNITMSGAGSNLTVGLSGTTDHSLQIGNVGGSLSSLAVGGTGVILQGVTGNDPAWSTATYPSTVALGDVLVASADNVIGVVNDITNAGYVLTANVGAAPSFQAPPSVTYASDAETIAGTVTNKAVAPSNLKAKLGSQTLHGLPIGASDSVAIAWTAEPTDGQILIGKTGNQPVLATISSGNNITATAGSGTISIAVTGTTQHAVQVGGASGQLASLAVGTTGKYLRAVTTADPAWSTLTLPDTVTKGDVLVASADNVVGSVAGATTAGHVLMANGAGSAPSFQALPPTGVTLTADDTNTASGASLTIAGGTNIGTTADGVSTLTINLDDTITLTQVNATTFDTNVVAAGTTLSGTTWAADGTDANIGMTITPKGTGNLTITTGDVALTSGNLLLPTTSSTVGQIKINSTRHYHAYGTSNTFLGQEAGNFTLTVGSATSNVGIGYGALDALTTGYRNVCVGYNAGGNNTRHHDNVFIGYNAGLIFYNWDDAHYNVVIGSEAWSVQSENGHSMGPVVAIGFRALRYYGQNSSHGTFVGPYAGQKLIGNHIGNTFIGYNAGGAMVGAAYPANTSKYNLLLGTDSGSSYTGVCSSNIILGTNPGVNLETNVMRLGAHGTGDYQQSKTYIAGVYSSSGTPSGTAQVTLIDSNYLSYGLAGAAGTVFIGGTAPSFSANPTLTSVLAGTFDTNVTAAGVTLSGTTLSADGTDADININITAKGSGTVIIDELTLTTQLAVGQGGTGAATLTDHGILLGSGTGAITPLGEASNGQLPIGSTGADPVLATLTAGTGISVTNGAGSITLASTSTTINDQSDSYTLVIGDAGKLIRMNKGSANTLTVPLNASVAFATGTVILVEQVGSGQTSIAATGGVTINSTGALLNLYGQYSVVCLIKVATNTWTLFGDLA